MFEVRLTKQPLHYLHKVPERIRKGLVASFEQLEQNPLLIAEPLHGPLKDKWKVRVGSLRLIMEIDLGAKRIKVIYIGPRGDSYK